MDKDREITPRPQAQVKDKLSREKFFLAEQATEGGLKVLPGKKWAFHYPKGSDLRDKSITDLLEGKIKPERAAENLRPDALVYDANDIDKEGLSSVVGKVRDVSSYVAYYDYPRFARFVTELSGTEVTPQIAQALYDGIAQSRVRKKVLDAYGHTGKKQMEDALRVEGQRTIGDIDNLPKLEKVLAGLKLNWMAEDLQVIRSEQRDQVLSGFSPAERQLYEQLKDVYVEYVKKGGEETYEKLVKKVKEQIPRIQEPETPERDESQEKLEEELEKYEDEAVPPVTPGDPAIPPEDSDEYHTPSASPWESKEDAEMNSYFEITPSGSSTKPMTGYYASGRKSYYDVDRKTWSKRKELSSVYSKNIEGSDRQTISATVGNGLTSIPIPNGYGLDMQSIKSKGGKPEIFRDQNGCFYIKSNGGGAFSVDFLKENPLFIGRPVADDIISMNRGLLSSKTEETIGKLQGGDLERAEQLRQYLVANHFYPGDGDLKMAQALQLKLRSESTGGNYIQNLDKSEYLECYSANTLFIAMLRRVGIPSRLVLGHHVEGAKDGKASINSTTGHAWTEVWDGKAWRRMDATPNAKQQKKDDEKNKDKNSPSQNAQDEGIERQDKQEGEDQERQEGQGQQGSKSQENSGQQMGEASDQDMQQGESQLSEAREVSKQAEGQKQQLDKKAQDAKSFKELKDLEKEVLDSDLFDDMKQDLQERLEAKEEQMKDEMKKELTEMEEDGFMDEKRREELEKQLEEAQLEELDRIRQQIERENKLFNEYQKIKEEVTPLVDQWFDYFADRLPKQEEVETDEDSLTRQGSFNRHSVMKPRNLLFGTVKNPRVVKPSIKPKFLASVMVDVSGSMEGAKLESARKMLVFYNELFSRIGEEFGFIKYANNIFSDNLVEIKKFDQDYESPTHYDWSDNTRSTVKMRLMQQLHVQGGTNMFPAIQKAAADLNKETVEYPDYASAFYFVGDGGDMHGNAQRIKEFLQLADGEQGFGTHMLSAIMLGNESQRRELANIFGDDHTTVAPDFETLIEQSMYKFDEDIGTYLKDKVI